MPPWGAQLGAEKIWKVLAYLETLPRSPRAGPRRARLPAARAGARRRAAREPRDVRRPNRRRAASAGCAPPRTRPSSRCCSRSPGSVVGGEPLVLLDVPRAALPRARSRDLPAGALLPLADPRRPRPRPLLLHDALRPGLVRLGLPADGLHRRVRRRRAPHRGLARLGSAGADRASGGRSRSTRCFAARERSSIGFHLVGYFRSPYELLPALARGAPLGRVARLPRRRPRCSPTSTSCSCARPSASTCAPTRASRACSSTATRWSSATTTGAASPGASGAGPQGDCVDCGLCVAVCPTGIDIRKGLQLECIACTQCIDACDGVMERLGRAAEPDRLPLAGRASPASAPRASCGPASRSTARLLAAVAASPSRCSLARRLPMDLQVAHNREALASRSADGRVGNAFTLRIENRDRAPRAFAPRAGRAGLRARGRREPDPRRRDERGRDARVRARRRRTPLGGRRRAPHLRARARAAPRRRPRACAPRASSPGRGAGRRCP